MPIMRLCRFVPEHSPSCCASTSSTQGVYIGFYDNLTSTTLSTLLYTSYSKAYPYEGEGSVLSLICAFD